MKDLEKLFELLLLTDKAIENKEFRKDLSYKVGSFDSGNRYRIHEEFTTESSNSVRGPSRKWNFSEWKHSQTTKYLKQLKQKLISEIAKHA